MAAVAAFAAALAAAWLVSGAGNADEPAPPVGVRAVAFDVSAPASGQPTIGQAAPLPALVRRKAKPAPAPAPAPAETETDTAPNTDTFEQTTPEPTPAPVTPSPAPVTPTPTPTPAPAPAPAPPVEFDDSG